MADRTPQFGPFICGLMGAVALGALASTMAADPAETAVLAIGMGIAAATFGSAAYLRTVAQWFYSALGVIAAIPVAISFLQDSQCSTASPALRYAVFALLFLLAALGFGLAAVAGKLSSAVGLGWFGALEILTFMTSPLAVDVLGDTAIPLALMVLVAAPFGALAAYQPEAVLAVAGTLIAIEEIGAAQLPTTCGTSGNSSGIVLIIVFTITYAAVRAVARKVRQN
ncbi:hypothetical protein [Skermania piniformis]|uniref:Integral membrane protein n=1 Tax=Skermania pinensis TaxID=39122 RepID=A0ABX8S6A6_9ACTN|nr:hypothetical protein [Skermania piniformis]QXQ13374.1 hypothetical protein KV203_16145 [Skermania piniformis]